MESSTISFLADLDKASDSRKANLCRSWKNAVLNEHGVYIDNRIDIDKYKTKKRVYPRITIHCALEYPKVYYSFDVIGENRCGGGLPGKESRNFDVHEHEANVALMVEQALREKITDDHKIPEKMIREVIEDFKAAKAEEIARGFTAEGWRPVPENERENAKFELGGWIDETKMDATSHRKGTRFFLIDVKSLTWKFFFRKEA